MTGEDQSSSDQVAEILLAMFGEKCSYLKSDVMGLVFSFQSEELVRTLPRELAPRMAMIARMATNVHAIDKWKRGLGVFGPTRRAFVDAVLEAYDSYLGLIDYARNRHLDGTEFSVKDTLNLVMEWYGRLDFLHSLIDTFGSKSETEIISLLYDEWSLHCIADWSHSLLESALNRCSVAFHKVACAWLLDGKLTGKEEWMIADLKSGGGGGGSTRDVPFELCSAPSPLAGSPDLVRKIYEIGRTVHFLKELRCQKTYEHRLQERTRLLDEGMDKQRLWHCPWVRGKLYLVLDLLARHVSADAFNELVVRQRLLDHIGYVHHFFYMLHGDFITNLESSIRESSKRGRSKSGQGYVTPKHSSPSFVAEACINYALKCSVHPAQFEDLRKYMTADRSKGSSKLNLADLFKLDYKPPRPIVTVLNESCIKRYRAVFTFICPHRFLQLSVSEVWWKLKRVAGAKLLRSRSKGLSHFVRVLYSHLDVLMNYSRVVVKYIFEDVLSVASAELLEEMRKVQDLDALVFRHEGHITDVIVALFLHRSTKEIYDRLFGCLNSARSLLSLLDQSVVKLEAELTQSSKLEAELAALQANKDKENVDVRRVASIEERLGAFNSLGPNTVAAYRKPLEQSANGLKDCLYALRASYEKLVTDAAIKHSSCWERFGDVLEFLGNQ